MSESQDATHEPAISVFTAQAGPSCKTGSATRPGETGWHVRSRFERQLIGASDLTVLEFSAGAERGWGCLVGDSFVIPTRLRRAGAAAAMWARFFGTTEWFDFGSLSGRPAPGGRHVGQPWAGGLPEEDIFTLWARTMDGELTVAAAVGSAARLGTVADSALTEAGIISKYLALHGRTREGALLGQVAVAAADVLGASEFARAQLAAEFLEAARARLTDVPSPKLLRAARAAGDAALAWARGRDQFVLVEMLTFRLGTLHLDPYTSNHDEDTYWLQHAVWLRRGMADLGLPPPNSSGEELRAFMPMPVPALCTAEDYLRQAIEARTGEYRGLALKALVQSLVFLRLLGENVTGDEIGQLAMQAALLLPDSQEDAQRYVRQFIPEEARAGLKDLPVPAGPAAGQADPLSALTTAAVGAAGRDPAASYALVARRREVLAGLVVPDMTTQLLLELRVAIMNTLIPAGRERERWPWIAAAQRELRQRIAAGEDPPAVGCALLLGLALDATRTGTGRAEGLLCVDDALRLDPDHLGMQDDAVTYLRGLLWFDRAGELRSGKRAEFDAAALVAAYARAADLFHRVGVPGQAVSALENLTPHFPQLDRQQCLEVLAELAGTTLGLGDRADPETDRVVQAYHATTLGHLLSSGMAHPELVIYTCQLAKGARLASALALGRNAGLAIPAKLRTEFCLADVADAALTGGGADDDGPDRPEDWLLLSYADTVETVPTDTPLRRLRGRQRQLDQAWNCLVPSPDKSLILSLAGVQQLLDSKMMLLVQLPAAWPTGTWGTSWLLVTGSAAHTQFVDSGIPYEDLAVEVADRTMHSSPNCASVVELRAGIQEDPGPDAATDDVLRGLDGRRRLGDLWTRIDELLRDGYDHLVVVPHGPGHYLPWHLLGAEAQPFAERCAVSVLPNLALLQHGSYTDLAMATLHRSPPASFGLSYRTVSSGGIGQLPSGEDEAAKVADILGVSAVLEERATADAVIEALENARYVHLSAHGRHNVDAAAFQGIQLAGTPGRLTAHRLSALDLRGLRLVTLSACETALGRFDRADNLRGIPAALFLAGVRSIVGTLWEARAAAAEVFFVALYQQLVTGRATIARAYRYAQEETRRAFPAYRDWGAFVLMGGLPEVYSSRGTQ